MNRFWVYGIALAIIIALGCGLKVSIERNGELNASLKQRESDIKSLNEQLDTQKKDRERIDKIISALDTTKAANEAQAHAMHKILVELRTDKQINACLDLRLPDGFVMRLRSAADENTSPKAISTGNSSQRLPQATH